MNFVTELLTGIDAVLEAVESILSAIQNVFGNINFTILYNWLPADIATAITACITVLFFLALIALVKKIVFFFG